MTETTVSWSVGEARALAVKAARGVGMPWGLAEEAGFALGWLTRHGAPGIMAICRYLSFYEAALNNGNAPSSVTYLGDDGWQCPLRLGTALSDGAVTQPANFSGVREPLLLLPFIANCADDGAAIQLNMGAIEILVTPDGFTSTSAATALLVDQSDCRITPAPKTTAVYPDPTFRVPKTACECIAVLTRLAHKTYAPATEASRLAGAGAGLSDND